MKYETYSLKLNDGDSEKYYSDINTLADQVISQAENSLLPIINDYVEYIKSFKLEEPLTKEEYIVDLLSFGILWRIYSKTAVSVEFAPFIFLSKLGVWRKKHQSIKTIIDYTRGMLISVFLLPDTRGKYISIKPTLENIDKVCRWFEATGEFREEALRFIRWRAYWGTLSDSQQGEIFSSIAKFIDWFDVRSVKILGRYTENVDQFLLDTQNRFRWREDRISCSRKRIEYHLNMVGACLMNRAFKNEFDDTETIVLLLPGCMRFRSNEECEAKKEQKGLKCTGCENACRVNYQRLMGLKKDFEVYVVPHASDLSLWAPKEGQTKKGIVACACVSTLVEGGWELKRYGIPAQCVLLDYSGCQKHWCETGIPTELNNKELNRIILKNNN